MWFIITRECDCLYHNISTRYLYIYSILQKGVNTILACVHMFIHETLEQSGLGILSISMFNGYFSYIYWMVFDTSVIAFTIHMQESCWFILLSQSYEYLIFRWNMPARRIQTNTQITNLPKSMQGINYFYMYVFIQITVFVFIIFRG